jgi:hypothetical protein
MLEWQRDWAALDTLDAVMDIVRTHCASYGAAVEYVNALARGAPAGSAFPAKRTARV